MTFLVMYVHRNSLATKSRLIRQGPAASRCEAQPYLCEHGTPAAPQGIDMYDHITRCSRH